VKNDKRLLLDADWTDDCQGKKDYDGEILSISTRYWPRGGGFSILQNVPGKSLSFEENESRPEIRPSAKSVLVIWHRANGERKDIVITSKSFEAETFEQIESEVRDWAQEQMDRAVGAIRREFQQ
jgi:hypothetical protein